MGNGDLAVLVAALLGVGDLVLDLDAARTGFDHLLGQEVGRLFVAESGVDVGDDGNDVGFEVVDGGQRGLFGCAVTGRLGLIEAPEQVVELTGVGLLEEGVELLDQLRHGGLLVHRLVGKRAELGAEGGNHPTRRDRGTALRSCRGAS